MTYDLNYHINLDKSHILPNILNGGYMGIVSQFISDIVLSVLLFNESIIITDIKISNISSYYASITVGMLAGILIIYLDPIATIIITTIFYNYSFKLFENIINNKQINFTPASDIFDAGIGVLILWAFDPTAKQKYYRYQQKRHFIEPTIPRKDRSLGLIIFFSILNSTYGWLKSSFKINN